MIRLRPGAERGRFRNDWLDARFSFSFGDYRDPAFDGWSDLVVFNDDQVAPGAGFAEHGHRDVEVMSYPVAGAVEHRDSLGHIATMRPGDVHLMRAGRGIRHSEMNASSTTPEHHLQWWIRPAAPGLRPAYQRLTWRDGRPGWHLLASPDAAQGALVVAQDVRVHAGLLDGAPLVQRLDPRRRGYLHVVAGAVQAGGHRLAAGDALLLDGETELRIDAGPDSPAEVLLFDLR
jgi:redox-sensitive bicupin YhaK (pirin superfamily)